MMAFKGTLQFGKNGKSLWLLQSLLVGPWRIFQAKIRMQLLLTDLPLLLCIVCMVAVYPLHPMQLLFVGFMLLPG